MPHVSNTNTHGSTRFVNHGGRQTWQNVGKDDLYRYDRSLVGNWVEERHVFPSTGTVTAGTLPVDTVRMTETTATIKPYNPYHNDDRLMAARTIAKGNAYTGHAGARGAILPDNAKNIWTGTSGLGGMLTNPVPSTTRVIDVRSRSIPVSSAYTTAMTQGLEPRPNRSWNRHILNYEDQFERGPYGEGPRHVKTLLLPKIPDGKFDPYTSTSRMHYNAAGATAQKPTFKATQKNTSFTKATLL